MIKIIALLTLLAKIAEVALKLEERSRKRKEVGERDRSGVNPEELGRGWEVSDL